jgi:hypothetical protein
MSRKMASGKADPWGLPLVVSWPTPSSLEPLATADVGPITAIQSQRLSRPNAAEPGRSRWKQSFSNPGGRICEREHCN